MDNKSNTNANSIQSTNGGNTVFIISDGGNKNSSNLAIQTGDQLPSSREVIDNSFTTEQTFWERLFSWRSFMVVHLHLLFVLARMHVVMISMSLVCMCGPVRGATKETRNNSRVSPILKYTEFPPLENVTRPQEQVYEFNWDSETRGLILSGAFFTSFLAPQLSNAIRSYIGNKWTLTILSVFFAFLSFISPFTARTSVYFFLAICILSGLCIHANIPISVDTLAWWIPAKEKLTSTTIVMSGWIVGASLGPVVAGYLCKTGIDNGWPLIFYLHGVLLVLWTIAWYSLSSRKPENHSYISEQEKTYILARRVGMNHVNTKGTNSTPFRTILTSCPVLAYVASIMSHLTLVIIVLTCLPLYLTSVFKFSVPEAGSVFSVITFMQLPGMLFWSLLGNWLLNRKYMPTNRVRKICYGLGQSLAAISYFGVSFLGENNKWLACVLVGVSIVSSTFGTTMTSLIPLDMAPRYAGFISGISTSVSGLTTLIGPLAVSAITVHGSFEEWRVVWICMAVVSSTAGMVFLIFGSASLQSWAVPETVSTTVKVQDQSSDLKLSNDPAAQPDPKSKKKPN